VSLLGVPHSTPPSAFFQAVLWPVQGHRCRAHQGLAEVGTTLAARIVERTDLAGHFTVIAVAETANPHRMGAALTYVRRYALFTLVGIAGEDADGRDRRAVDRNIDGPAGGLEPPPSSYGNGRARGAAKPARPPVLSPDQSAVLRDRLLREIAALPSEDSAADWAQRALAAKNQLTAADARLLQVAFELRLSALLPSRSGLSVGSGSQGPSSFAGDDTIRTSPGPVDVGNDQPARVDKSTLPVPAPRRYRDKVHLRYVAQQACLLCGRKPSDPHHLRHLQPRALGRKASDEFAVPLCRIHHRLVHRVGNEAAWWKDAGIDPAKAARKLWNDSRSVTDGIPSSNSDDHGHSGNVLTPSS